MKWTWPVIGSGDQPRVRVCCGLRCGHTDNQTVRETLHWSPRQFEHWTTAWNLWMDVSPNWDAFSPVSGPPVWTTKHWRRL